MRVFLALVFLLLCLSKFNSFHFCVLISVTEISITDDEHCARFAAAIPAIYCNFVASALAPAAQTTPLASFE